MRLFTASLMLGAALLAAGAGADEKKYSMADLEALQKSSSWQELLEHATDIAPTQRNAAWEKMVEQAATEEIKGDSRGAHWTVSALTKQFPFLKKSSSFMALGSSQSFESFEPCFDRWDVSRCIKDIHAFLDQHPGNTADALKAGQLIARRSNAQNATRAFRLALTDKDRKACADEALQRSTLAGLGLPDGENLQAAKEIATKFCWKELKEAINQQFSSEPNGYFATNVCPMLKANGMLSGLRAKKCEGKG